MRSDLSEQSFIPVILGANIGVYSIARSFHEAYGVTSISISRRLIGPINHSRIITPIVEKNMDEQAGLISCLNKISMTYPDTPKFLIGSNEEHVQMIINLKNLAEYDWMIPYTDNESLQKVINKNDFYRLCEELDVDYPKCLSLGPNATLSTELNFAFPVVIKPSNRISYDALTFAGKMKVFTANDQKELQDTVSLVREAGYQEDLIIQEFIPGDDTAMHILTLYITKDDETKMASFGQTLLEDHTPGGIGNPLAIRTLRNDEVVEQAERIVKRAGFVGFANFDLKYDSRDGTYKFFELNPRLGRSNYYITASGINPVQYYVKDYLINAKDIVFSSTNREVLYSVVPKRLLLKNIADKDLNQRVKKLYKKRRVKNPMFYFSVEKKIKRIFYVLLSTINFYRKFKKYPANHDVSVDVEQPESAEHKERSKILS